MSIPIIIFTAIILSGLGRLGLWVASQKGRSDLEGFALGFFFGPFRIILEA